ncbi:hypothetical protein B296_00055430 [Ensete ventricosum]|uniref:BZIP domain-containing protein n=1 Tax=Ensete ventricosum TaxID=4639 RepID=A0A426WWS5_ENSVE|nr:hypothetical protein B296_00055430 [Ensete ventricosum]
MRQLLVLRTRGYPIFDLLTWQHVGALPLRSRDPNHADRLPLSLSKSRQAAIVGPTHGQLVAPWRPRTAPSTLRRESGARSAPRCYIASRGVPMASPAPLSSGRERRGVGHRGMVELELDAARALTDLTGSAATGSESGGEECKRNERRSGKRSKSKSPERAQLGSFQGQEASSILGVRELPEHLKFRFLQAEKEQRRLRRVMANRESARQTIRRRQVMNFLIMFMYPSWPAILGNTIAFFGQPNPSNISGSVPPQNLPSCARYYPFRGGEHRLGKSHREADNTERAAVHGTDDVESSLLATAGTETANAPEAGGVSGGINKDEQILKTPAEETITRGSSHDEKCELQYGKALPEKLQGACAQPPPDKLSNTTSATAAAEARRRRLELRKLKRCHGGQEDMRF